MGNILSCCFSHDSEESESLLADQNGYGSQREMDYNELEQQQQQWILDRERELTQIVNNTNDKLIDIGMINNSGIVTVSSDMDLDGRPASEDLSAVSSEKICEQTREAVRNLHKKYFDMLEKNCMIKFDKPLVAEIQSK